MNSTFVLSDTSFYGARKVCACLLLLAAVSASARGQVVSGVVMLPDSVSPAAGVLVELRLLRSGALRTLTDQRGRFQFELSEPDSFYVRALRIGFAPTVTDTTFVSRGQVLNLEIVASRSGYMLNRVTVAGSSRCGKRANSEGWFRYEQSQTAFNTVTVSLRDSAYDVRIVEYRGPTDASGLTKIETDSMLRLVPSISQPSNAHYDSLFARGFARRNRGDTAVTYYAPDARFIGDDRFLGQYCLRALSVEDSVPGYVAVAFEPVDRRRFTDIRGVIWLREQSLELAKVEFSYLWLPADRQLDGAGGFVAFTKLPGGYWFANEWMLRMPHPLITRHRPCYNWRGELVNNPELQGRCPYRVTQDFGLWALGHIVASVTWKGDTLYREPTAEDLARRAALLIKR